MWNPKRLEHLQPSAYVRRASTFIDRQFQLKYSERAFWLITVGSLLVTLPLIYFLNQNYSILRDLIGDTEPSLVSYLEREQIFLNIALVSIFVGQLVFVRVFSHRMTAKIVGPIKKLRNHLRLLSRGELSAPALRVREDDEFQYLIASFNYFYSGLQEQTERDLIRLKEARKLSNHPLLSDNLDQMIQEKSMQLDLKTSTSEESERSADSRHAS